MSGLEMMISATIKGLGFDRAKIEAMGREYAAKFEAFAHRNSETHDGVRALLSGQMRIEAQLALLLTQRRDIVPPLADGFALDMTAEQIRDAMAIGDNTQVNVEQFAAQL